MFFIIVCLSIESPYPLVADVIKVRWADDYLFGFKIIVYSWGYLRII